MLLAIVVIIIVVVAAVGAYWYTASRSSKTSTTTQLKLAVIHNGMSDWPGWWNQFTLAAESLQSKFNYSLSFTENVVSASDQTSDAETLAAAGTNVIWMDSGSGETTMPPAAKAYPKIDFVTGGQDDDNLTNMFCIFDQARPMLYVGGALAAMMSKTHIIGYIIGEAYPSLIDYANGFFLGAKMEDPNVTCLPMATTGSWTDEGAGKDAATALFDQGADVVGTWSSLGDIGACIAAQETSLSQNRSNWVFTADQDIYNEFSASVAIGGIYYNFTNEINYIFTRLQNGSGFPSGTFLINAASYRPAGSDFYGFGLSRYDVIYNSQFVPAADITTLNTIRQQVILAGDIQTIVPNPSTVLGYNATYWNPTVPYTLIPGGPP